MKIKTIDKNIKLVKSEESKALNKNLVACHKSFKLVFNSTVLAHTHLRKGQYATFSADMFSRTILINFHEEKINSSARKVFDPMFSKISNYLAISIKNLIWSDGLVCLGAFEYEYRPELKLMTIHF